MKNEQFERFVEAEKAKLAECLRGSGRLDEHIPDMPGIGDAHSLCEQFYDSIGQPVDAWVAFPNDGIDWEALRKELSNFVDEVWAEWMERKKAQDRVDAFEMGRE
jgi:hypothetical protein